MLKFIIIYSIIFMIFMLLIPIPYANADQTCKEQADIFDEKIKTNGYELVYHIPHPYSSNLIELTLCWIVDEEIQVGKLITLNAKVNSIHYMLNNTTFDKIELVFPHNIINYWQNSSEPRQKLYLTSNVLELNRINSTFFEANEPINMRITVPNSITIQYCEFTNNSNTNSDCFNVTNILKPASYYLDREIKINDELVNISNELLKLTNSIFYLTLLLIVTSSIPLLITTIRRKLSLYTCLIILFVIVVVIFFILNKIYYFFP